MLRPFLAPLVRITSVIGAIFQDVVPYVSGDHGRIPSCAKPDRSILENRPTVTNMGISPTLVAVPHCQWSLIPANVAGSVIVTSMLAVTADGSAATIAECIVRLAILAQNPDLQHVAGLPIGRTIGQTGHNANNGGPIVWAKAFPQDAAVHVGLSHHLLGAMESSDLPDERILDHRQAGCQSLVKT